MMKIAKLWPKSKYLTPNVRRGVPAEDTSFEEIALDNLIDSAWYREEYGIGINTDVRNYFLQVGWREGHDPSVWFNSKFYFDQDMSLRDLDICPLLHFLESGHREGRFPNPIFNPEWYLSQNSDLLDLQINPLVHYILYGEQEGRCPSEFFDPFWYLSKYGDVAKEKFSPGRHFLQYGANEGRDPSPLFNVNWYLDKYPDVKASGIDPVYHYTRFGRAENRIPTPTASFHDPYKAWQQGNEYVNKTAEKDLSRLANYLVYKPVFSIVVPTYNTDLDILREFIQSVIDQIYPHWELCIADDASPKAAVRDVLEEFAAKDDRIKLTFRQQNGRISLCTNSALELASGDFICLMDHDDLITADALLAFAIELNTDPTIDMIYSDEDKITVAGNRYEPFFKPDWSPEYLESCMYTAHFACYRKSIVDKIGGFRRQFDGAQDYDFVLRFTEQAGKIIHIPKVLYRWRAIPGSTAQSMDEKSYVIGAAVGALQSRIDRSGIGGTVVPNKYGGCFDLIYDVVGSPLVSIVIPSAGRNGDVRGESVDLLAHCINSILDKSTYKNIEFVVVDNGDLREETVDAIDVASPKYVTFSEEKFNIAKKLNMGVEAARGEYVLLLNDDIEVISPNWIEAMLSVAQKPGVGAVGAKLHFADGTLQHVGVTFWEGLPDHILRGAPADDPGYFFSSVAMRNYLAVTGACLLVSRDLYQAVGGFDEDFAINYNDIDFCLKIIDQGLRNVFTPHARLYHYESMNRERSVDDSEIELFLARWKAKLAVDPYYSSYLDPHPPNFLLKEPA